MIGDRRWRHNNRDALLSFAKQESVLLSEGTNIMGYFCLAS